MSEFNASTEVETLKNPLVVVKFFATWCGPCKMLKPVIERLVEANPDVVFVECDTDRNPDMSEKYNVTGLPTTLFLAEGLEAGRIKGLKRQSDYQSQIDSMK